MSKNRSQMHHLAESEMSSINFSQDEKEKKKKQRRQSEGQTKGRTQHDDEDRQ